MGDGVKAAVPRDRVPSMYEIQQKMNDTIQSIDEKLDALAIFLDVDYGSRMNTKVDIEVKDFTTAMVYTVHKLAKIDEVVGFLKYCLKGD